MPTLTRRLQQWIDQANSAVTVTDLDHVVNQVANSISYHNTNDLSYLDEAETLSDCIQHALSNDILVLREDYLEDLAEYARFLRYCEALAYDLY